jgi:hypothetical protein
MKNAIRKAIYSILTFLMGREWLLFLLSNQQERNLLGFKREGYLYDIGWVKSMTDQNVVGKDGRPLPWVTFPFIAFIDDRLKRDLEIFEYGSGNSTLYYAAKVASVDSVENDKYWYEKIKNTMPQNTKLFFCDLEYGGAYSKYAAETGKYYDMIIVDGRDRVNCCISSISSLKPGGVVVLDDSERKDYEAAPAFLLENGFKKIDFWGMAPMVSNHKCTTIFYRGNNCLGI